MFCATPAILSRFHWHQETFNNIDWSNFAIVYQQFPQQRTFFSKLGWKKLPVAARLHKRTPCYDHHCPTYNEDDDHIYQCGHIFRSSWRTSLFGIINAKFHVILDPDLLAIIPLGLWQQEGCKKTSSTAKTSWPPSTKQSSLGFLSSKRPQYQVGTKLLLDTGIYDDDVPEKVIDHMFVYKIVKLYPNDMTVKIEYKIKSSLKEGTSFANTRIPKKPR
jgi:hypothetical protein